MALKADTVPGTAAAAASANTEDGGVDARGPFPDGHPK